MCHSPTVDNRSSGGLGQGEGFKVHTNPDAPSTLARMGVAAGRGPIECQWSKEDPTTPSSLPNVLPVISPGRAAEMVEFGACHMACRDLNQVSEVSGEDWDYRRATGLGWGLMGEEAVEKWVSVRAHRTVQLHRSIKGQ